MKNRLLAAFLCLIMAMTLLPTAALAEGTHYGSWADAMAPGSGLAENDTIAIDGITYKYKEFPTSGFDLNSSAMFNDDLCIYKAGEGKVLWVPTYNSSGEITSGKLTFDNATITVAVGSGAEPVTPAVTMPSFETNVIFKNTNHITATNASGEAVVFSSKNSIVTYTAEEGSKTRLTAKGTSAKVIGASGRLITIDGPGEMILDPQVSTDRAETDGVRGQRI